MKREIPQGIVQSNIHTCYSPGRGMDEFSLQLFPIEYNDVGRAFEGLRSCVVILVGVRTSYTCALCIAQMTSTVLCAHQFFLVFLHFIFTKMELLTHEAKIKGKHLASLKLFLQSSNKIPLSSKKMQMSSPKLAEALGMTSQKINDINYVKFIWWHFYQMYRILRKDTAQLKPGHPSSSTNVEDYEFGLHDSEISRYVYHANMFHALMIFRYGCKEVTPYMMKFVDVVPKHLCSTPFKSLMRVATEGGERTHYMHICFYYQVCKTNIYK